METHIIVALSLTLLFLLFVMWKDRQVHNKLETLETQMSELKGLVSDEKGVDQAGSQELEIQMSELKGLVSDARVVDQAGSRALETQISQLQNSVNALLQDNKKDALKDTLKDVFAEVVPQEINVLCDIARKADELQVEIEGMKQLPTPIAFKNLPPKLPQKNDYWQDLSRWMRKEKQWRCEKCCIDLKDRQQDLHVHHIFGRGFNSPQHLMVLCRACHAEEPGHAFMKAFPEYEAFLKWVKETQHEQTRNNR